MKKINVKPIETLGLEFEDGTIKKCKFSAYAMMILDEEYDGFTKTFKDSQNTPFLSGAKLLYAGMKACGDDVTFEDAKVVASNMTVESILDLFEFAANTIKVDKKKYKIPQDFKQKKKYNHKKKI
ncbi:hypothetical protein SH1V18_14900 [Vallitalea longa]|uniref:Uncharacterized protein n=1 Tax=Vallitalea longa TaxID=2936439 RepID=A0A9W6DE21_9FIRM|nr:hypothetical protein [Vallitalea longa]GKX29010.1 hypothetical protein SH1V18_14900 [Vallitalea longa]